MKQKFRAWHKTWEEMGKVKRIRFDDEGNVATVLFEGKILGVNTHADEIELMQSTGLFDKTNTEIFEGDIVKMSKDVSVDTTYYEVVRRRGGAYSLESKQHGCDLWIRHTDCEIIGNVYENKEFLEDME